MRLMKFFSRQLLLKHMFLREYQEGGGAEGEIDNLIDLSLFLQIADLQPLSVQVCVSLSVCGCVSLPPLSPSAGETRAAVAGWPVCPALSRPGEGGSL